MQISTSEFRSQNYDEYYICLLMTSSLNLRNGWSYPGMNTCYRKAEMNQWRQKDVWAALKIKERDERLNKSNALKHLQNVPFSDQSRISFLHFFFLFFYFSKIFSFLWWGNWNSKNQNQLWMIFPLFLISTTSNSSVRRTLSVIHTILSLFYANDFPYVLRKLNLF